MERVAPDLLGGCRIEQARRAWSALAIRIQPDRLSRIESVGTSPRRLRLQALTVGQSLQDRPGGCAGSVRSSKRRARRTVSIRSRSDRQSGIDLSGAPSRGPRPRTSSACTHRPIASKDAADTSPVGRSESCDCPDPGIRMTQVHPLSLWRESALGLIPTKPSAIARPARGRSKIAASLRSPTNARCASSLHYSSLSDSSATSRGAFTRTNFRLFFAGPTRGSS